MTEKKEEQTQAAQTLKSIEEWREKHSIAAPVFAGMKAEKRWKPGKKVEEREFLKAYKDFCEGPVDGRKGAKG